MLLSSSYRSVKFAVGTTVCEQDLTGFLADEYPAAAAPGARMGPWTLGLSQYEMPFCLYLAGGLAPGWGGHLPVCRFLERFTSFYRNNRTHIELAARELHHVVDGLLALQPWPALFRFLLDTMGEQSDSAIPKGVSAKDVAGFLGRLLIGKGPAQVSLGGLPELLHTIRELPTGPAVACLRIPHYARIMENLERAAARVTPVVNQLRDALEAC